MEVRLMSEAQRCLFTPSFNRAIKIRQRDSRLTSHAGAIILREADHRLGLIESVVERMLDPRNQDKIRYTLSELLRERVFALALGESAQDDLDRLAHDPALRMATWDRSGEQVLDERLASQPMQSRLLNILAGRPEHLEVLRDALADWTERHLRSTGGDHAVRYGTLDIDSFPVLVAGQQPGGAYNGYYEETVYHPLLASFAVVGDYDSPMQGQRLGNGFVHAILRAGNAGSAQGMVRFVDKALEKCQGLGVVLDVRIDAGLTHGAVLDHLTDRKTRFVGRLKTNAVLDRLAEPYLRRPAGRPPREGYETIVELGPYQAEPWRHAQRLILVVVDQPDPRTGQLNLLPRHFFIVTNWTAEKKDAEAVLEHYRRRGTFEDRIGEFNATVHPQLSSPKFEENEALLLLSLLSFNLSSMLRNELEASIGGCWDLGRFQQTVLRAAGRVVRGGRRLWLDLEAAFTPLWEKVLACLQRWRLPKRWKAPHGPSRRDWVPPPSHAHLHLTLRL
jgi:hypothetical protein